MPRVGSICPSLAPVAEPTTKLCSELPPAAWLWPISCPRRPGRPSRVSLSLETLFKTAGMAPAGRLTRAGEVRGL